MNSDSLDVVDKRCAIDGLGIRFGSFRHDEQDQEEDSESEGEDVLPMLDPRALGQGVLEIPVVYRWVWERALADRRRRHQAMGPKKS